MDIPSKYDPNRVEKHWYNYWMEHDFFSSTPDDREPYTIVIPPPNVTGVLHMGHMMNATIQDVLIRKARLEGKNACWVPGMDHASIATEAKVVAKLAEDGISKADISREKFLEHAWNWTDKYGGVILEQLKKLGCSCDWNRTKFTMDDDMSASVIKVFVELYEKGLIYRGHRMVNWDPEAKTTLSDEEVIYEEKQGLLYYVTYDILGSDEKVTIATTRPETILGDTAICINPTDERYAHLKGKKAIVPICNREIPIIEDPYVDVEFGTGCLKVTPAHDENDKNLGDKHKLEVVDIFNEDATLNSYGLHYEGKDRFVVRKEIAKELEKEGYLVKTEPYVNKVGTSERTKAVIEPRLSDQWFLKMEDLAKPALDAVLKNGEVKLYPKKFENTYRHWMENIRDWNISRQLWWGQQIPAYYYGDGQDDFVVAENIDRALELAKAKTQNSTLKTENLRQDPDVLDTWFSSWLWPISVFGGILEPENPEVKYYYPTNDLVTGPDILFFWVARMIVAGYEFRNERPYENVYLTGLVRDKQRRKMSKSLGNSPDALKLIEEFGAGGVRVGLLLSSAAGNDLLFDEALCQQGKNFANKIWNAFRLVKGWEIKKEENPANEIAIKWFEHKFNEFTAQLEKEYKQFRVSEAIKLIYNFVWNEFFSWYLEMIKPPYQQAIDEKTYLKTLDFFEAVLKVLHPFMPFITEEIWHQLKDKSEKEFICLVDYPKENKSDKTFLKASEKIIELISQVRNIRNKKQISPKESLEIAINSKDTIYKDFENIVKKLANLSEIQYVTESKSDWASFMVQTDECFINLEDNIDQEAEKARIEKEIKYLEGFRNSVLKKLNNERFVQNAPEKVINIEKQKLADAESKLKSLKANL